MIKGVIFDLDGVLVSTDNFHYQAWKEVSKKYNLDLTYKQNDLLRGVGRMDCVDIILKLNNATMTDIEKNSYAKEKNDLYLSLLENLNSNNANDGAQKTLSCLKSVNIAIALGSASKNARFILDKLALIDYFDAIIDGNMIEKSKPDPQIYIKSVEQLCLRPNECLVIEDADAGMISAKKAGCLCASINNDDEFGNADYHVNNLFEIVKLIETINAK